MNFMLLESYTGFDLTGWYLSEKYDGCRARWDGYRLHSRSGRIVPAPSWFTDQLPKGFELDGELWAGYDAFRYASLAARYGGEHLQGVAFIVFDAPGVRGPWPERLRQAARAINGSEVAAVVDWTVAESTDHAMAMLEDVRRMGGEGLVARAPQAGFYSEGRTRFAVKIKEPRV